MADYSKQIKVATQAVSRAAIICRAVQRDLATEDALSKKDKSPVTVADFASQAIVCHTLKQAFGGVPVVGEETADQLRLASQTAIRKSVVNQVQSALGDLSEDDVLDLIDRGGAVPEGNTQRFWTIDPVDGTKGFLRHQQYAIALALIENGKVVVGALACPNLPTDSVEIDKNNPIGTLITAARGRTALMYELGSGSGAWPGAPMTLKADEKSLSKYSRFCESVESAHSDQSWSAKIAKTLGITAPPVRIDSQAKYAVVARGGASIYLRLPRNADYQENIWDHAAGSIIVEQAGGTVTDINGKPLDFSRGRTLSKNQGIIATFGQEHDQVVKATLDARR